jgi:phosphoserine phosphatase RsbU/P
MPFGVRTATAPDADVRLLAAALEAMEQAMCIVDMRAPDQPLVHANDAFLRLTGYTRAQLLGRNCRLLQGGLDCGPQRAAIRGLLAAGRSGEVLLRNRRADGAVFDNELSLSPLRDDLGTVTHFVGVQRDVTARLRAEHTRDALRREREDLAEQLQRELVPAVLPEVTGYRVAVRYRPATRPDGSRGEVSGDFYDLVEPGGGPAFALIGDVSGRGPRAAAATTALRWSVRGAVTATSTPARLLRTVNAAVLDVMGERFATMAVGALPTQRGREGEDVVAQVALAGHPPPVLLPRQGRPAAVGAAGSIIGAFPAVDVVDTAVRLPPGSQLVLYTDGVTEARSPCGRMLGEEGLLAALAGLSSHDRTATDAAQRTADAVVAAVDGHVDGGTVDDVTLLVVARTWADPG